MNEPSEVAASNIAFVGSHATHIVGMLNADVVVQIIERRPHPAGVLLIDTEHDGFRESIRLLEECGQMPRDSLRAGAQGHHALEVLG